MKAAFYGAMAMLALVLMLALLAQPTTEHASTLEVLVQPDAAAQLELQRQSHELQMAEVAAREADARAEAATLRLAIVLAAVVVVSLCAAVVVATRRRTTFVLLPGSPQFHAALMEEGGYYIDGQPWCNGQPVTYLEGVREDYE